jgi:hypothetical protein
MKIAHNKLKLDLFEHRYEIYDVMLESAIKVSTSDYDQQAVQRYYAAARKARWIARKCAVV